MIYAVETISDYEPKDFTRDLDAAIDRWQAQNLDVEVQYSAASRRTSPGGAYSGAVEYTALVIAHQR